MLAPASNVLFHVGRCVRLARELASRGHRVVVAGSERYLRDPAIVGTEGFEYEPLPDFECEEAMAILRDLHRRPSRARVEEMLDAERAMLRRLQPDLVVTDFRPTLQISARLEDIPTASLLLGHWLQQYADFELPALKTDRLSVFMRGLVGERLTARFAPTVVRLASHYKTSAFRAAGRARGLDESGQEIWNLLEGDVNLVADSPAWCPTRPLPPSYTWIGPFFWEPYASLPEEVATVGPSSAVVYVSFGSTGHPKLFQRVFEELSGDWCRVFLATCGQIDLRDFDVPSNFVLARFLPGSKVLEAADLIVYHGGAGTAHQAIRAGVPGISIATHWDQEYQGYAAERNGTGIALSLQEVVEHPGRIRAAVHEVLQNLESFRERVRVLQREFLRYEAPATATRCLEQFLSERCERIS